jgi:Family of unknown function (DUF6338)
MQFFENQKWLVYVLPGFVALFVAGFISDFPEIRDTQLPIIYVALTLLSVAIPLSCLHVYGARRGIAYDINKITQRPGVVATIFAFSVFLGFSFGIAHTTDYISRLLRSIFGRDIILVSSHSEPISVLFKLAYEGEKFGRELDGQPYVPSEIQNFASRFVRIRFEENQEEYEGVVTSYFGSTERRQVYLSPACKIDSTAVVPIRGPGVWLNLEKVQSVQFIYSMCSECKSLIDISAGQQSSVMCPIK